MYQKNTCMEGKGLPFSYKKRQFVIPPCNAPTDRLTTEQASICYRNAYRIEHKFDELLNRITALLPVFFKKNTESNHLSDFYCSHLNL